MAAAAGVGRASAARALGGYGAVSPELRRRVEEAAAALGYRSNALARNLSLGSSRTLGVVVADIANPFFAGVVRGITDTARRAGLDTVVLNTDEDLDDEAHAVEVLLEKSVDGLVVATAAGADAPVPHLHEAAAQVPLVLVDRVVHGLAVDSVTIDNAAAARAGTAALLEAGHRRVGLVWGPALQPVPAQRGRLLSALDSAVSTGADRVRGYLDALRAARVPFDPDLVALTESTVEAAQDATDRMLDLPDPATALLTTDDFALLGVLRVLGRRGLRPGADVSLVGFDDVPWAELWSPPLTMIAQPLLALGTEVAELLLARIGGRDDPPRAVRLPAQLVRRDSIGPR